jgi:hypothetical protein
MHTLPSRMDGVIAHVCGSSAFRLAASGKVQKSDDVLLMRRLITTASLFGCKLLLRFGCVSGPLPKLLLLHQPSQWEGLVTRLVSEVCGKTAKD